MKSASRANSFRLLIWLFPLSVMAAIFLFSAQTGAESGMLSGGLTRWLLNAASRIFPINDPDRFAVSAGTVIRKLAHVTEFTVLYLSLLLAFKTTDPRRPAHPFRALISLLLTFIYASGDELHQLFVPGRACAPTDVLIDVSLPAVVTAVTVLKAVIVLNKAKTRKKHSDDK